MTTRRPSKFTHDWESRLAPFDPRRDGIPTAIIGARRVLTPTPHWSGEQLMPPGRECALCPTILHRLNRAAICGPCERAARDIYPPPVVLDPACVVYYARRDGLIKIGTTTDLTVRLRVLDVELLATEPGSFQQEAIRHNQFAHLNVRGEWFRPEGDLLVHIDGLLASQEQAA